MQLPVPNNDATLSATSINSPTLHGHYAKLLSYTLSPPPLPTQHTFKLATMKHS